MIVLLGDIVSVLTVVLAVVFCIIYALTADWSTRDDGKKEFIWHIMAWATVGTLLDIYRTALIFVRKGDPDWEVFRLVVYVAVLYVVLWRLKVLLWRNRKIASEAEDARQ